MRAACFFVLLGLVSTANGQGNLLRNGDFQDDWLTHLPELKNHHWNYTTEVYNRRDYNPDNWRMTGKWQWNDADKPRGQRAVVLSSPSRAAQCVNWVVIHNAAKLEGWPDAGGYPRAEAVRSKNPLALVRDLTFRVNLSGKDVPKDAVSVQLSWCDVLADDVPPKMRSATVSISAPEGTYEQKEVEVRLPASTWLEVAKQDKAFDSQGALIPQAVLCEIVYAKDQAGSVTLLGGVLSEPGPKAPNLLPHGGFETANMDTAVGWSGPQKYRYFPPGIYYIFNTWHNSNSDNRGRVFRDSLVPHQGQASLCMTIPTGDEVCVTSDPITLDQTSPEPIEVRAWVKSHQVAMMQIDAMDENGARLNGYNHIQKAPLSIGTNDWRTVRTVFRPAAPLKSIRLKLCARGMNGYTLNGTGHQPQQNAAGVLWWDDIEVFEPGTEAKDLTARGVKTEPAEPNQPGPHLTQFDFGEQLLGTNYVTTDIENPSGREAPFKLELSLGEGENRQTVEAIEAPAGWVPPVNLDKGLAGEKLVAKPRAGAGQQRRSYVGIGYTLSQPGQAYHEQSLTLTLRDSAGKVLATSTYPVATWTVPIDLEVGALYLQPDEKQFVRSNLGLAAEETSRLKELRLEVVRLGTGQVLKTIVLPATPAAIEQQRAKIAVGMRDDLRNLLVTDIDVSSLPLMPFNDPQRQFAIRATAVTTDGKPAWSHTSAPFCRLGHDGPQPSIQTASINERGDFLIDEKPWMPWGVTYGHNPVYSGPAESGKYYDLGNLKPWGIYDGHGGNLANRALWDLNSIRYVESKPLTPGQLQDMWKNGTYASTVFFPQDRKAWPEELLKYVGNAPMVASVSRGPEEAFGYYTAMTPQQLADLKADVDQLRKATGKPVMTGHGGYWTRLEFEPVPFFDIYDPETEPWYPAAVHTDLAPLVKGQKKAIWLRPQMYESVPYERWRYHVFVELIRGARGWQLAHGPGDASTFRGLHGELKQLQPAIYSAEKVPVVTIEPPLENLVRKSGNKTTIIAASTHGLSFGNWRNSNEKHGEDLARVTNGEHIFRDESDGYHATGDPNHLSLCPHGIQNLAYPKQWPAGTKLVTWAKIDPQSRPKNLVAIVKGDGRWNYAAAWGKFDINQLRNNNEQAFWFLRTFYRHARGFLSWGNTAPPYSLAFMPTQTTSLGEVPAESDWVKLEVPLDKIGAVGKLIDGVAFMHDGGRVWWARTSLVTPDGQETIVFGDHEDRPAPAALAKTKFTVAGLKKGTKISVAFEDRVLTAEDGYFVDDFSGVDLYQRYGGERLGYGNAPVALHIYEITP